MHRWSRRPEHGSAQRWAWRYIRSKRLEEKIAPPAIPELWEEDAPERRLPAPGRPAQLRVIPKARKSISRGALRNPRRRAELLHTFWHHELQAAELMAWALLAFPQTSRAFRQGLLAICLDEVRHMGLYQREIERLGSGIGDFPVRDWFWQRVPACQSPLEFVAVMGMGFEAGNLDHSQRYAEIFRELGDPALVELQELIAREELAHVRFALHWFERWTGSRDFESWREALCAPLSPALFRGKQLNRPARLAAGMPAAFLDAFERNQSEAPRGTTNQAPSRRDEDRATKHES